MYISNYILNMLKQWLKKVNNDRNKHRLIKKRLSDKIVIYIKLKKVIYNAKYFK